MIYIPTDWLNNEANMDKVHDILSKLDNDIITENLYTEAEAVKELEALNEDIIIEKLKAKAFIFGA